MKKRMLCVVQLLVIGLVCFGVVSVTSAQSLKFGIGGGAYLPTGDAADSFNISPGIHGTLLVGLQNIIKFDGEIIYWILLESDDLDADDFSASFYVATGGLRLYPLPTVHVDAGFGVYKADFEWDLPGFNAENSDTYGGVYGGAGFELGNLDIKARAHAPDFDDFYIGATITYLFDIQSLF
jgi:hypothetical protein